MKNFTDGHCTYGRKKKRGQLIIWGHINNSLLKGGMVGYFQPLAICQLAWCTMHTEYSPKLNYQFL